MLLEVLDRSANSFVEVHFWFPAEHFSRPGDVWLPHFWIVYRQWFVFDRRFGAGHPPDLFCELLNRHFARAAQVHRFVKIAYRQPEYSVNQIAHVTERPSLSAVPKNR